MVTAKNAKSRKRNVAKVPASIVWFEIPADNLQRARKFYSKLFGWKITKFPGMSMPYWHVDTRGGDQTPDGGMLDRQSPQHGITNYISVASVDKAAANVRKLGGKVIMPRTAVPQMGYFVICQDTEKNMFALWERDGSAA
jgi:predicted enzyme related to lactoylglutathione lyase